MCPLSCPPAPSNGAVEPRGSGIIIRVSGVRVPPPAPPEALQTAGLSRSERRDRPLRGRWTRRLTTADIRTAGRTPATGVWNARFADNGVVFFAGPHGARGAEAFTAIRSGLIALAGPVLWLAPERNRGRHCGGERLAPYAWRVHASALTLTTRHDGDCPSRAALFAGTWTHPINAQRQEGTPP